MKKLTDKEIIELLKSHEEKKYNYAIKYLKFHYFKLIIFILLKKGADKELAEEIFGDGILQLFKYGQHQSFKEGSCIEALFKTICQNILYKKIKRDKSVNTVPLLSEFNDFKDDGIIPEVLLSDELRNKLDKTLSRLGGNCQQMIEMTFFRGLTNEEIRRIFEYASVDTVKQTKRRCMKKLRDIIDGFGGKDFFGFL